LPEELYKLCRKCGIKKPITEFNKNISKKDGLQSQCKTCGHQKDVSWRQNIKNEVCKKYGGQCENCGFDHILSLQIHHKNGRDITESANGAMLYRRLLQEPIRNDLSLLCNSCHQATHSANAEYELLFLKLLGTINRAAIDHRLNTVIKAGKIVRELAKWQKNQINQ